MADITKIKYGSNVYDIKDADAARQKQADWNTNNGVKNLIEITADSQTINGLTFTVDKSKGTIDVKGTSTADTEFVFADLSSMSLHGSKYILSGSPNGNYLSYWITMSYRPSLSSTSAQLRNYTGDTPCDMTNGYPNNCSITISNGLTISDLVFKPMLRYDFIEDSTFVPYAMNNAEITDAIGDLIDGLKYAKFTFPRHSNASHTAGWYTICKLASGSSSLATGHWFTLGIRGVWNTTSPITAIFLCAIRLNECQIKEQICPGLGNAFSKIRIAMKDGIYYIEVYSPGTSSGIFGYQYFTLIGDFELYEPEGCNRIMSLTPNTEEMTVSAELNITVL